MTKYVSVQVTRKGGPPPVDTEGGGALCPSCREPADPVALEEALWVCPHCDHHYSLDAPARIGMLADPGTWREVGGELRPEDPLDFFDVRPYVERLDEAQVETGLSEALLTGVCTIEERPVALGVSDFRFMGGSMGSVMGERFHRLVLRAIEDHCPVVMVTASGGARMQEGIFSLMQMPKTVVALDLLAGAGLPFVSVLAHPTTGGVLASFASLADVIMAEPGALLCFAGPRVIEQTTREKLPEGFGRAESILEHGQIDMVVHRHQLKEQLVKTLRLLEGGVYCRLEESLRQDEEVVPWGSSPLAQAFARAKELAHASRGWLLGRDT
ncbi:MAG: acetyl-CoA carboxylase, carboxyltransferase subunit beta [Thermoleophilia bacterium]